MARERYRTLASAQELKKFTVAELATHAAVKESTVRTHLKRDARFFVVIDRQRTGGVGGQPIRYEVDEDQRVALTAELRRLELGLPVPRREAPQGDPPAALLVAEDYLLRRVPAAGQDVDQRKRATDLSRDLLDDARKAIASQPNPSDISLRHSTIAQWLFDLACAELDAGPTAAEIVQACEHAWMDVLHLRDARLAEQFIARVRRSPLLESSPLWRLFPPARPRRAVLYDGVRGKDNSTQRIKEALTAADVDIDERLHVNDLYSHESADMCVLTVEASDRRVGEKIRTVCRSLDPFTEFIVTSKDFDRALRRQVYRQDGRYLSLDDLNRDDLVTALLRENVRRRLEALVHGTAS